MLSKIAQKSDIRKTTSMSYVPVEGRKRVAIERVTPNVDDGRFPAKRILGDTVRVEADIFVDGHDAIAAVMSWRQDDATGWIEVPMHSGTNDRWFAEIQVTQLGSYRFA